LDLEDSEEIQPEKPASPIKLTIESPVKNFESPLSSAYNSPLYANGRELKGVPLDKYNAKIKR
jgi:hypothetical protein